MIRKTVSGGEKILKTLHERLRSREILVSDGGWGTMLIRKGLQPGECPELWIIEHREQVFEIASEYVSAGADIIGTNTFGGNRLKLEHYGLGDRAGELNRQAAAISKEAAKSNAEVFGSVGPTGKILMMGDTSEKELYQAFNEQIVALEEGGVDAVCIETMMDLDEARLAIKAAKENTGLMIACTFTFIKSSEGVYHTMMGITPAQMIEAVVAAGVDIAGTNCGNGIENMVEIVKEMRAANQDIPIIVQSNAGVPENKSGVDVYPDSPEKMVKYAPELMNAGANIIGGCCGTTPAHIKALANYIKKGG